MTFLSVTAIAVIAVSAISFVSQAQTYAATPGGSPISSHILLLLPFDNLSGTLSGPSDPASAQSPRQRVQPGHSRLDRISNAAPKIFNSRFLIRCKAVARMDLAQVSTLCGAAMREFGVPELIRTANGAPFAGVGLPGLSKLTLGWTKLGIVHALFQSGYPQLNGRNERMHRTLKEEATKSPARTVTAQQKKFDRFRYVFNHERSHEALANETPGSIYVPGTRLFPSRVTNFQYPRSFQTRRVNNSGGVRDIHVGTCAGSFFGAGILA